MAKAAKARTVNTVARDRLVVEHLSLVRVIAAHIRESLPVHVELDDLISAGMLGLLAAASKFDPERHIPFPVYAKCRIRGAILDALRSVDWASRQTRRMFKEMERASEELTAILRREPTGDEIAAKLGLDIDEWRKLSMQIRVPGTISASARRDDDELPAPDFPCALALHPDRMCLESELRQVLQTALATLKPRYRTVMQLYYEQGLRMHEIAEVMDVNESRVCQMHKLALERLHARLSAAGITGVKAFAAAA